MRISDWSSDVCSSDLFGPEAYNTTSNLVTWKVGANWKPTDQVMIYANVATGFKSPAFNTSLVGPGGAAPADPEQNTNFEIGMKAETDDPKLQGSILALHTYHRKHHKTTIPEHNSSE